ncbi:MAG: Txe/YoeB family addiction module toxin [Bacteroidota bacterium]
MGKYIIILDKLAAVDFKKHAKSGDKLTIKKLNQIFEELKSHPKTGIGNPEALKYSLSNYWSRKINRKDRFIYRIE